MRSVRVFCGVLVILSVIAVGASLPVSAEDPAEKPVKIYLVPHCACSWDAFWCPIEKGIKDAAQAMNVDVTLLTTETFNPEESARNVDKALAAKPDALGVVVTDGKLFEEPMMRAIRSGIPVIAYNAPDMRPREERIPYLFYIGQDEYLAGYEGGKALLKDGGKRGVCLNQGVGHTGLDARCRGFADAFAEDNQSVDVLAITYEPAESAGIIQDYYAAHPDVDTWFALGPSGSVAVYAAMDKLGLKPGDIHFGTMGLSPLDIQKIKEGYTLFDVDQQPYLQGYLTVEFLAMKVRHDLSPVSDIVLGPLLVTKDNLAFVEEQTGTYR